MKFDPHIPLLNRKGDPINVAPNEPATTGALAIQLLDSTSEKDGREKRRRRTMADKIERALDTGGLADLDKVDFDVIDDLIRDNCNNYLYSLYHDHTEAMKEASKEPVKTKPSLVSDTAEPDAA